MMRKKISIGVVIILLSLSFSAFTFAESIDGKAPFFFQDTPTSLLAKSPKDIFQNISPAVVYITTQTMFGEDYLGSGFVVDSKGIIVTNYHVIQSAKEINVKLKDGRTFPVTSVIYYDVNRDICILKINAQNLPAIPLGDSNAISIGETIYCIGNPLGLEYSFSDGMLSGTRDFQGLKWLQFTAPISPGNSGGPLVNSKGEAIGIVTFLMPGGQNINFALAINEIKPYISKYPKMTFKEYVENVSQADYYLIQGNNYFFQRDFDQALAYYQKALQLDTKNEEVYLSLALAYFYLDKHQRAITYFQKALQVNPNDVETYNNLAVAYQTLGQFDQAINYYQKSLELDPSNLAACTNFGFLNYDLNQYQQAITYLQKALQMDHSLTGAYFYIGHSYSSLGQYQQAIPFYQKALQIDPRDAKIYAQLGIVYSALEQYRLAANNYYKAQEIDPNYPGIYAGLAFAYHSLSQYEKAKIYYQKDLQINPNAVESYSGLGLVYYDLDQYKEAKENFLKAKELYQSSGDYKSVQLIEEYLNKLP